MALSRIRHLTSHYRPSPDRAWIFSGVVLLHLALLGLLLTFRILLPEAPEGPVFRLETAVFVPNPPLPPGESDAWTMAAPSVLLPVPLPDLEPNMLLAEEARQRSARAAARRSPEAVIAEEVLTPSLAANSLGGRGFDFMSPPTYAEPFLQNRMPPYPPAARGVRAEGTVVLRVLVTPYGRGHSAEIYKSSGHARLDEAARQAVLRWAYIPAERGRRPVLSWTLIPIRFQADGAVLLDEAALFSR